MTATPDRRAYGRLVWHAGLAIALLAAVGGCRDAASWMASGQRADEDDIRAVTLTPERRSVTWNVTFTVDPMQDHPDVVARLEVLLPLVAPSGTRVTGTAWASRIAITATRLPDGVPLPVREQESDYGITGSFAPFSSCGPTTACEAHVAVTAHLTGPDAVNVQGLVRLVATYPSQYGQESVDGDGSGVSVLISAP